MVERIYVEKLPKYDTAVPKLKADIYGTLGIKLDYLRRILRYDVEGLGKEDLERAKQSVFSEPTVDTVGEKIDGIEGKTALVVEYLDGQFDQRADSAAQCVSLLTAGKRPSVRCATVYLFDGISEGELARIKKFLINAVDSKEGSFDLPETLERVSPERKNMRVELTSFNDMDEKALKEYYDGFGFAMSFEDLLFVQEYFRREGRVPTHTELKVVDTYWSDHCRHTTFLTELKDVTFLCDNPHIEESWELYKKTFEEVYGDRKDKYPCLMDIATLAVKKLRKDGYLQEMDVSEEINACSVVCKIDNDGKEEEWLIMFKNETHNHPTEIEPFGGAATCLGGAIRDPLSGRAYVYQAMRITGAADPNEDYRKTLPGKLPQRVLTKTALAGFSCYGNQIGLATGTVRELYNDGYKAKRLETGYVIGGAPRERVKRRRPVKGDVVILVGGATGRDGCGGATGSSKSHTAASLDTCGAEVQKGNAPEERKLQRLFRSEEASPLIVRCNDFGAGGVCVAIGELSDGLDIYLDRVKVKYDGLTATELAISESQERMAVVVDGKDAEKFIALADKENLDATVVAEVTDGGRLRMFYKDETIVDIARDFLDTNGVKQVRSAKLVYKADGYFNSLDNHTDMLIKGEDIKGALKYELAKLNNCSQKGAGETFDSTIGAATVLMPFGGKYQLTPSLVMAAKPPVDGFTHSVTVSSFGINTELLSVNPFTGAVYSVVTAVNKLIAAGVKKETIYLTLQEFFKRLNKDPERWGEPLAALLGAFYAQMKMKKGAIGGKDSMSGSFENIDVPPTLIAFAMGLTTDEKILHNAFSSTGYVYRLKLKKDEYGLPNFEYLETLYDIIAKLNDEGKLLNATVVESNAAVALAQSLFGNGAGLEVEIPRRTLFINAVGDFIVVTKEKSCPQGEYIGKLNDTGVISTEKGKVSLAELGNYYEGTLEKVFPTTAKAEGKAKNVSFVSGEKFASTVKIARPRVFIPVFPGTNCEYDTAKAFERAGAVADICVVRNRSAKDIAETIEEMASKIKEANIIAFPGGFSGGDEPDGSGKFIATAFRNPRLEEAVNDLLYRRDGLVLGICNGFQALIKLGLLPYGKIAPQTADSATLTFNNIARHVSTVTNVRIATDKSPWLCNFKVGDIYSVPVSHGEGKFICPDSVMENLIKNGQIATQYVDFDGNATMESPFNPNGSFMAVEGIISPDGRVFGKMGHTERYQDGLYRNVDGNFDMNVFASAVKYFR